MARSSGGTQQRRLRQAPRDPRAGDNPDEFLFWDGIHPTKATHAIIAATVATLLML